MHGPAEQPLERLIDHLVLLHQRLALELRRLHAGFEVVVPLEGGHLHERTRQRALDPTSNFFRTDEFHRASYQDRQVYQTGMTRPEIRVTLCAMPGPTKGALWLLTVAVLAGCGCTAPDGSYVERGDLPGLEGRGRVRILLPVQRPETLPRRGQTLDFDLKLARMLADELGLEPVMITLEDRSELLQGLLEGRGDIAVARLTATAERRKRWLFSVPVDHVREVVVHRDGEDPIERIGDLAGREVAVRPSSSYHETLLRIRESVPDLTIVSVDERLDTEQLLYGVAVGEYDVTVADEDLVEEVLSYRPELRAGVALTDERPIAWAMRPGARKLKEAVDGFLHRQALTRHLDEKLLGDLDLVRERRVLRVLTRNNAASYFLYRGQQVGFEFDLARSFARELGCRLQVVVPPGADDLIPWLLEGRGDMVAASLTVTDERSKTVAFSRPYNYVSEVVVARADEAGIDGSEDLAGRDVVVRPSSSYHESLVALQPDIPVNIIPASEQMETEDLIAAVGDGDIDITVADSHILDIELTYRDDVKGAFVLGERKRLAWAFRPGDDRLREAANSFLGREYRGELYNVLYRRYFKDSRRIARVVPARSARAGRISPYDELFREVAREVEIDWRLLAAQAYAESEFVPDAQSWAGARGLMQVLPRTALQMGVEGALEDPGNGVRAGALYLRHLIDQFEPSLPMGERLRMALGAYNAGLGHIRDGRRLARERGFDPDRWFGHVERVLPLLSKEPFYSRSRYGYCRCRQTVAYVRRIQDQYAAYARVLD